MEADHKQAAKDGAKGGVSVLDQALWSRLNDDWSLAEFAKIWLALTVSQTGGIESGVVVILTGDDFAPVATWPKAKPPGRDLASVVEKAIDTERGVCVEASVAQPLMLDGECLGAVGLRFDSVRGDPAEDLKKLMWNIGWLVSAIRAESARSESQDIKNQSAVLDVVGAVLEADGLRATCLAAATVLARRLDCTQVAVAFLKRRKLVIEALSDVADNRMNTNYSQSLALAMSEVTDQQGSVLYPPREGQPYVVATKHAELVRARNSGDVLSIPLFSRDRVIGAVHLEKPSKSSFGHAEIVIAEATAAALGPIFAEKLLTNRNALRTMSDALLRQTGRLLGPRYLGRKMAVLVLAALIATVWFVKGDFRVAAQSEVEGQVVRSLVAPFDGHIYEQYARAGDVIKKAAPLARLDERDLQIEYLRWTTDLGRYQGEYDRALADRDAAAAKIAEAEIAQSRAKAELVKLQLERAVLVAPFDAVVIEGDLSQSLGVAVRRGEQLFRLATLDSYRVTLEVEERDLNEVQVGQLGNLVLTSLPEERFGFAVTQITPRLEAAEGRNFALVEARLTEVSDQIRPGMRGIAKIDIEERRLIDIWSRPIIDWFRLALWRWLP